MKAGNILLRFQRLTWIAGIASFLLVVGVAGSAAAVRQESTNGNSLLRGVEIGGVSIEGLDYDAARRRLESAFDEPLDRPITVNLDGKPIASTTRRALGAQTDVDAVLRRAMELHSKMSPIKRLWYRITGMTMGTHLEVRTSFADGSTGSFIDKIAKDVYKAPKDATFSLSGAGIKVKAEEAGFKLDEKTAAEAVRRALDDDQPINLSGAVVAPAVTTKTFKDIIVVKIGENRLYHYRDGNILKTYAVATGLPKYPTPTGTFKIVEKRFRPTWVNPATGKGEWGEKLPAKIGPGPDNPLGTRAMNLSVPGIRIHGTKTDASLGFNASHGCIRMKMSDVEELFDRVSTGTPVMILHSGPMKIYQPTGAPTLEQLVESDGALIAAPPAVAASPSPAPAVSPSPESAPAPSPELEPAPAPTPDAEQSAADELAGLGLNLSGVPSSDD